MTKTCRYIRVKTQWQWKYCNTVIKLEFEHPKHSGHSKWMTIFAQLELNRNSSNKIIAIVLFGSYFREYLSFSRELLWCPCFPPHALTQWRAFESVYFALNHESHPHSEHLVAWDRSTSVNKPTRLLYTWEALWSNLTSMQTNTFLCSQVKHRKWGRKLVGDSTELFRINAVVKQSKNRLIAIDIWKD